MYTAFVLLCALLIQPFLMGYVAFCAKNGNRRAVAGAVAAVIIALGSPLLLFLIV